MEISKSLINLGFKEIVVKENINTIDLKRFIFYGTYLERVLVVVIDKKLVNNSYEIKKIELNHPNDKMLILKLFGINPSVKDIIKKIEKAKFR